MATARSDKSLRLAKGVHGQANKLIAEMRSLFRELESSYERQAFTQQVDDAILHSGSNPAAVLDFIIEHALAKTSSRYGRVVEYRDGRLVIAASTDAELVGLELSLDGSLCGHAVTSNRDQRVDDIGQLQLSDYTGTHEDTRAELALLISPGRGKRVLGVLDLQRSDHPYSDAEYAFASTLTGQLAIAIQHAREREAFESIFGTLTSGLPGGLAASDEVYDGFVRAVLHALNANYGQLMRWTGSDFVIVASSQSSDVGLRLRSSAISRYVRDEGGTALRIIDSIERSPYSEDYVSMLVSPRGRMKTEAILPLYVETELVGALNLESRHARAFSGQERHLLEALQLPLARALYATSQQFRRISRERIDAAQLALASVRTATGGLLHQTGASVSDARYKVLRIQRLQQRSTDPQLLSDLVSELMPGILGSLDAAGGDIKKLTTSLHPDRPPYDPIVVDLQEICLGALERARRRYPRLSIDYENKLPCHPSASSNERVITAAPCELDAQAYELLLNLLDNAARAVHQRWRRAPGGKVVLALGLRDSGHARIQVIDNGVGMTPEIVERVFDYGFSSRPDGSESLGVGLWWCHLYLQQHGGSIGVDSKSDFGTTFEVLLPLAQGPIAGRRDASDIN
jgi:signal transduction histidine kinase